MKRQWFFCGHGEGEKRKLAMRVKRYWLFCGHVENGKGKLAG